MKTWDLSFRLLVDRLIEGAIELRFKGIGIAQKGEGRFIHIDDIPNSPDRPRPWIWSY